MQLLHSHSEEGNVECLGVLPGLVRRMQIPLPVPHMGWNRLLIDRAHPLLDGLGPEPYVYFVHSYAVSPDGDTLAHAQYGIPVSAAVSRGNFHGVQFHPERSAAVGAQILRNFLALEG
jgi:glutamine amidotransferase